MEQIHIVSYVKFGHEGGGQVKHYFVPFLNFTVEQMMIYRGYGRGVRSQSQYLLDNIINVRYIFFCF